MAKVAKKNKDTAAELPITPAAKQGKTKVVQIEAEQPPVLNSIPMKISTEEQIMAEVAEMPPIDSSTCIKDVACQLLTAVRVEDKADEYTKHDGTKAYRVVGFSYASILKKISIMFPNSTTSNACLRWYLVRIRQELEGFDKYKMPIKFKRPKSML